MDMLTTQDFVRAKEFVMTHTRPLEQHIFAHYFEDDSADAVLGALATFQNPDGGFGNALEPDLRLPDSSVLATTVGLQVLREFGAAQNHPLVRGAMDYLMQTYDADLNAWPIIPPNTDDAPHAPWWTYSENNAEAWGGYLLNPRAEIVGYLWDYAALVPSDIGDIASRLTIDVMDHVGEYAQDIEMHDLLCLKRLVETGALPAGERAQLLKILRPIVDRMVVKTPTEWHKYGLKPLDIVTSPSSPFADLFSNALQENLDFIIHQQAENGSWEPTWSWGELYPETWKKAKVDWAGVLTVRTLRILRDFGRWE